MRGDTTTILRGVLVDSRRGMLGWTLGAMVVSIFYLSFYPLIGGDQMDQMLSLMPQGVMEAFGMADISSASGYANATVYTLLGLIIVLIFGITFGARVLGGEEEAGVLELEYTGPLSRTQTYVGRITALWIGLAVAVTGLSLAVTIVNALATLHIDYGYIWLSGLGMWLITGAFATIGFAVGAGTGRRSAALGASVTLAVVCYLLNAVGPLADIGWMSSISPFHWYNSNVSIQNGPDWGGYGLLVILAVVPGILGWLAMKRRDLMV